MEMVRFPACCAFVMVSCLLLSFFLPCPSVVHAAARISMLPLTPAPRLLSFQLHLQSTPSTPLNLQHDATQPFSPFLFSNQPLFHFDENSHKLTSVGSARGLYLAHPAASTDLRYLFFTASLHNLPSAYTAAKAGGGDRDGSLVLMGSLSSGAISVIGGTGGFAFANGQAKVSMAGTAEPEQIVLSFDVELQHEESDDATFL